MRKYILLLLLTYLPFQAKTQETGIVEKESKELKYAFNESGSHYVKLTFTNQVWVRFNQNNPGTTLYETREDNTYDIGLRRTRIQLFGQISDRIFFYTQFGQNNLSFHSPRKLGLFFLDGVAEYKVAADQLSVGGGLTGWSGLSRYASPSVGTILTMDAPLYQQTTNDVNDQFLRKFSVYAKGKLGKLDYRVALTKPMSVQTSTAQADGISKNSLFSSEPGKIQLQGYFMYQFLEQESNLTPYNVGSYLGEKRVFNIGAGFITQKDAMWHLSEDRMDTLRSNLALFAIDVFYDTPLNTGKGDAITAYASFSFSDFGRNYIRNIGAMNPATGVDANGSLNGAGNAFPAIGTGNTLYAQLGYMFKNDLLGNLGTLQPYAASQYSDFELLTDPMIMYEAGVNWLIEDHRSKLTLNYQSRPVFTMNSMGDYINSSRRGMFVIQFQVNI